MNVAKAETRVEIDIWLNPKYQYNGNLVAKFRTGKGQTTISQESTLQVKNGSGNGSPLTQSNLKKDEIQKNYSGQDMSYVLLNKVPSLTAYSDKVS